MKKGFTLMEVLAVLIILAILAIVSIPLYLNLIKSSNDQSVILSAKKYVSTIEDLALKIEDNNGITLSGIYSVDGAIRGYLSSNIKFEGNKVTNGMITIESERVKSANLCINNKSVKYEEGRYTIEKNENYCTAMYVDREGMFDDNVIFLPELPNLNNKYLWFNENGSSSGFSILFGEDNFTMISEFGTDSQLYYIKKLDLSFHEKIVVEGERISGDGSFKHLYICANTQNPTSYNRDYCITNKPDIGKFKYEIDISNLEGERFLSLAFCYGEIKINKWYLE